MIKINYKSDFKINEKSETIALEVPFVFSYYVFDSKKYVVSFDGHNYVNCERKEDGSLDVIFNQPDFGIGHLKVERKYAVDDKAFDDGVFDVVTVDKTDVFITSGKTFETYIETLVVPPFLKGDKGDPMTWDTMTETERGELVHDVAEAIDPEMVMTENEKARQEAERSRQTAEQQRSSTFNTLKGEMQSAITAGNEAATNAQKVVDEYDTKVAEQDGKLSELGSEVDDFKEAVTNQVNNYKPIEINGNVTNAADEEDITSDENNLLKLKNRNNLNGMGYVILRNNKTFAEQITQTNTIYEIRYDFDLNGESVTIPSGCALNFSGGSLSNGKININLATLLGKPKIYTLISGYAGVCTDVYYSWFHRSDESDSDTLDRLGTWLYNKDNGSSANVRLMIDKSLVLDRTWHLYKNTSIIGIGDNFKVQVSCSNNFVGDSVVNITGTSTNDLWGFRVYISDILFNCSSYAGTSITSIIKINHAYGIVLANLKILGNSKIIDALNVSTVNHTIFENIKISDFNASNGHGINCVENIYGLTINKTDIELCYRGIRISSNCKVDINNPYFERNTIAFYIGTNSEGKVNINGGVIRISNTGSWGMYAYGENINAYGLWFDPNGSHVSTSSVTRNCYILNSNGVKVKGDGIGGVFTSGNMGNSVRAIGGSLIVTNLNKYKVATFGVVNNSAQRTIVEIDIHYQMNDSVYFTMKKTVCVYYDSGLKVKVLDLSTSIGKTNNFNYSFNAEVQIVDNKKAFVYIIPVLRGALANDTTSARISYKVSASIPNINENPSIYFVDNDEVETISELPTSELMPANGKTAERPIPLYVGYQYYDTSLSKPIWWNGSKWVDSMGADV